MKSIHTDRITQAVCTLCTQACIHAGDDLVGALTQAKTEERYKGAQDILAQLLENLSIAHRDSMPICQDTGMAVVFLDVGQDVHIHGALLTDAVNEGVRKAYLGHALRQSVLSPLLRENTGDNTPAILHTQIVPGTSLHISMAPKGFGSENMSAVHMLSPSAGIEGVKQAVIQTVDRAGGNPCPPVVLGVGIGGTMEMAALLAERQLLRPLGRPSDDPVLARLESELLAAINALGIGPMGFGGDTTALAVHIAQYPTHIAALPVAVNIQCHAYRHGSIILEGI